MGIDLVQIIINSVVTGSVYALAAVGLTMVYGVLKFANFAHAEAITFGAYMAYVVNVTLGGSLLLGVVAAFVLTGLLGVISDTLVFRRLREKEATRTSIMIASIGLGLVVRHLIQGIWGPWVRWYDYRESSSLEILGGRITMIESLTILTALALMFSLHILLTRTKLGKAMRATSDNPPLALASGIDIDGVVLWVWFIGAGAAGIGGVLWGGITYLGPLMGWWLLLPVFAVIVLGGSGSFYGTVLASYILGFVENFGVVMLMQLHLSTSYRTAIAFVILIVVLLVKPTGLMGVGGED